MKAKIFLLLIALAVVAALVYGYRQMSRERTAEAKGEKPVASESKVQRGANGEAVVNLDPAAQRLVGLATAPLAAATLAPEVEAYGRVLDPSSLVGLLSDFASAQAALEASSREHQRVNALFREGENASAKARDAAEAAMKRDQIARQAAEARLVSEWGRSVATEPELGAFVQALAARQSVLVRLDLPAGEIPGAAPTGARLALPGRAPPVAARLLGRAPTADPQVQGEGFLLVVTNAPAALSPGLAVTGFLQWPGEPARGVAVPDDAVVRWADRAWVYVQTGDTTFARREIPLNHPTAGGWFVGLGVAPGDRLVVTGAQTLLSEERKSQIQVGD